MQHAFANIDWPGRFETLSKTPQIIIDGAHNPHAAHALVETWEKEFGSQKATLVFGAVEEKDVRLVLDILCQIAEVIHICPINSPRTLSADGMIAALPKNAPQHHSHSNLKSCLDSLSNHDKPILVAGSLFLIGEAKALFSNDSFQRSTQ